MSIEGQGHLYVIYVLCSTRLRNQVSVYRTIGPLVVFVIVCICKLAVLEQLSVIEDTFISPINHGY